MKKFELSGLIMPKFGVTKSVKKAGRVPTTDNIPVCKLGMAYNNNNINRLPPRIINDAAQYKGPRSIYHGDFDEGNYKVPPLERRLDILEAPGKDDHLRIKDEIDIEVDKLNKMVFEDDRPSQPTLIGKNVLVVESDEEDEASLPTEGDATPRILSRSTTPRMESSGDATPRRLSRPTTPKTPSLGDATPRRLSRPTTPKTPSLGDASPRRLSRFNSLVKIPSFSIMEEMMKQK